MTPQDKAPQDSEITLEAREGYLYARLVPGLAMACFVQGHVPDEQTEFFKTAAMNRGVRVEFFSNREEALRWLGIRPKL